MLVKPEQILRSEEAVAAEVPAASTGGSGALFTKEAPVETAAPAATAAAAETVPEWKKSFPDELKTAPSLKMIHDVETLAKSYVNAQKLIGGDKIPVPSKHATPDEWKEVFNKIGLPATLGDYKVDLPEEMMSKANPESLKTVTEAAYKLNILPHQLKGLLETYHNLETGASKKFQEGLDAEQETAIGNLKKEWGVAFEAKANIAANVLRENATEEDWKFLENSGLTKSPELARIMAKVGEKLYGEAQIKTGAHKNNGKLSPDEALVEIQSLQFDTAYTDASHPGHQKAVAEMRRFYEMAYPSNQA